ncbi:MAG: hypothetical protein AAB336_10585 [Acidobacteriota bacterium]
MSIIKLGSPPFPVKINSDGSCFAKLEHLWQAARRYAKKNNLEISESYGVIGVAPF